MSLSAEHSWPDSANPGPGHLPDLERTLRGMRPATQRYQEPVSSFQADLGEDCDDEKCSKKTLRRRR